MTRRDVLSARVLLAVVALLAALAWWLPIRLDDEQWGAFWIGHLPPAREARAVTLAFGTRFDFPFDVPRMTVKLRADRHYDLRVDGRLIGDGGGAGREAPLDVWNLEGPFATGGHEIVVVVSHPQGVASLRLTLDAERVGRGCVATGPGWRVDEDPARVLAGGVAAARFDATPWARAPLAAWGLVPARRTFRGTVPLPPP